MKKSQLSSIQVVVILLVVFFVILTATNGMVREMVEKGEVNACLLSVIATASTRGTPTDIMSLKCYTKLYGEIKPKGRNDAEKKDSVMATIADLSYECWMQFGQGEYDVFKGSKGISKPLRCFVCSNFEMPNVKVSEKELIEYLRDSPIAKNKVTYLEYLQKGLFWRKYKEGVPDYAPGPYLLLASIKIPDQNFLEKSESFIRDTIDKFSVSKYLTEQELKEKFTNVFANQVEKKPYVDDINKNIFEKNQNGYAIVYMQMSDSYWEQSWIAKGLNLVDDMLLDLYKSDPIPGAYIVMTKYEDVKDLGCESLQG